MKMTIECRVDEIYPESLIEHYKRVLPMKINIFGRDYNFIVKDFSESSRVKVNNTYTIELVPLEYTL